MIRRITLSLSLMLLCKAVASGYSGDGLRGMNELRQIAQSILVYAHEHEGKVPVPYAEVPGVAGSIDLLDRTRGTVVLGAHENFSLVDTVPVGFYTLGDIVIVGYSDGTARYHRYTDRPPWVALRHGPTLGQRLMIASPILNIILLILVLDLWLSKRRKEGRSGYDAGSAPVAEWVSSVATGFLAFLLAWILLELLRFVAAPAPGNRFLDLLLLLIAAAIGYLIFRIRNRRRAGYERPQ